MSRVRPTSLVSALQALDEAVGVSIFGEHRPQDGRRHGRLTALLDVRLALCNVLLLLFHAVEMLHHRVGQPVRFPELAIALLRDRLLPALRKALDRPVASRWPGI